MTNVERAKEFMDYIHFNFDDTELDEKFLKDYFKNQDNKENYMELLWMSLSFLHETDGDFKIYAYNPLNDYFEKAHNIAVRVLITVEELINDNLFEFVPTEDLLYINNLLLRAELLEKIGRNPDYKLTPYEAMKVIEIFKCADNPEIVSETFTRNLNHFLSEKSNKMYHKALETLNEMLKIDGYIIEASDDNTKTVNDDTKFKATASCENPDKIESSIKPGDINNDLDLKIREAEDEAAVAEQLSKSNNSCLGNVDWKKKAIEKRQIVRWLKELKYYKENDNDKDKFYEWVYRKDTDRLHCSYCGASSSYDSYGPIQTPYCCYCGKKMLKTWDYHDPRRVDVNG